MASAASDKLDRVLGPWTATAIVIGTVIGSGVFKKPAVVALARKLLVVCWAMLRSGQPWREPEAAAVG